MSNVWIVVIIFAGVLLALFLRRPRAVPVAFANEREERLARRLAQMVGCGPADALPAVREELRIGESQPDDVLLQRAKYHYQQNAPEKTCGVWRDRAPG